MQAAKVFGKPIVLNEFGLIVSPHTLAPEQYSSARDRFFQAIITEGQILGLQGLLAWDAVPDMALVPGQYVVRESKLNTYSPVEVDINDPGHTQRRVLMYQPDWALFEWRSGNAVPNATPAAKAIASAWADIPQPSPVLPRVPRP
jgi:hypothetical protein